MSTEPEKKPEPEKPLDPIEQERKKLSDMQMLNMELADNLAGKCLGQLLLLGYTFGAIINPETGNPQFAIQAITLEEWQEIAKLKVRAELDPLRKGRPPANDSGIIV